MQRTSITQLVVTGAGAALLVSSIAGLVRAPGDMAAEGDAAASGDITIRDFSFTPEATTVAVGDTVTWTNEDDATHTVTSTEGGPLDSGDIEGRMAFQRTFDEPGTYEYMCSFHPNMEGTVEVNG